MAFSVSPMPRQGEVRGPREMQKKGEVKSNREIDATSRLNRVIEERYTRKDS